MAIRTTTSSILSSSQNNSNNRTLKDIILDFKVSKDNPKVSHKVRLIGEPIVYLEYTNKKRDYDNLDEKGRPTEIEVPFPDAAFNNSFTRIGHDDPSQCDWAKLGYIPNKKYAQNCIERTSDGKFEIKILNKGATVFKPIAQWEKGQLETNLENKDVKGATPEIAFIGGRKAPVARITAEYAPTKPGRVEYSVNFTSAVELTEEEINALLELNKPTAEALAEAKEDFDLKRMQNPYYPEFEDFYIGGHNLFNIFKYTPIKTEATNSSNNNNSTNSKPVVIEDDEDIVAPVIEEKKVKASTPASVFAEVEEDDEDAWTI